MEIAPFFPAIFLKHHRLVTKLKKEYGKYGELAHVRLDPTKLRSVESYTQPNGSISNTFLESSKKSSDRKASDACNMSLAAKAASTQ